ncbi:MAG TPA: hypothetical protein VLZ12_09455 [Verrucomicrobiae bacterium]|nr:hypothetical protein [Verrucomicrobiae bacterium]
MSQRAVLIGAVVAIIGSGAVLYKYFAQPKTTDAASKNLFEAYTQVAAQEISHLLGGRGDVVVLMWGPPADDAKDPAGPPVVQAFCRALPRVGLRVLAKESVPPVPAGYDIVWTADNYRQILERYPQAAALVSFVGDPQVRAENVHELPARRPKLVVVRGGKAENARELFELGVLDGAVLPCVEPPSSDRAPKSAREWFDRYYLFITPQTASELH